MAVPPLRGTGPPPPPPSSLRLPRPARGTPAATAPHDSARHTRTDTSSPDSAHTGRPNLSSTARSAARRAARPPRPALAQLSFGPPADGATNVSLGWQLQ